ncbi:nucleolar complex protein 4 homolog [Brevipalpus obovatus]|uniref:nucleolar complex protein 4 homolog n=1 Tax=Brevipalpus obovatus TaxID=246614 RepID=UPI003D9E8159
MTCQGERLLNTVRDLKPELIPEEKEPFTKEFSETLVKNVCQEILTSSSSETADKLINAIGECYRAHDVKHFVLRAMLPLLKSLKKEQEDNPLCENFINRAYSLLTLIELDIPGKNNKKKKSIPNELMDLDEGETTIYLVKNPPKSFVQSSLSYEKIADLFAAVWIVFLSFELDKSMYRSILKMMDKKIMPHFRNPLSLADFLIQSYNIGGSASLLSLSSLFILIQKCNLEYPDFFKRLYALLTPDMLYVKYRARLFYWTDIFLTSTHLPAYMVAAFAKRLSRLTLLATIDAQSFLIPLIGNLLVRHPSLNVMINRTTQETLESDPYDPEEEDPAKCNAMDSSLWEVRTLLAHWNPQVAKKAAFIKKKIPEKEWDISEDLETSYDDLMSDSISVLDDNVLTLSVDENMRNRLKIFAQN